MFWHALVGSSQREILGAIQYDGQRSDVWSSSWPSLFFQDARRNGTVFGPYGINASETSCQLIFVCQGWMLLVTSPRDVLLSICIGMGGCGCPISVCFCVHSCRVRRVWLQPPKTQQIWLVGRCLIQHHSLRGPWCRMTWKNGLLLDCVLLICWGVKHCFVQQVPCCLLSRW